MVKPLDHLKNLSLLKTKSYINGVWVEGQKTPFSVKDPALDEVLTEIASVSAQQTREAVDAACQAFQIWKHVSPFERAEKLTYFAELIEKNREDLAVLITAEMGKPYREALTEVDYALSFVTWYAEEAKRTGGNLLDSPWQGSRFLAMKQPVGVVSIITPWNFPAAMITRKMAPALAAGCSTLIKPAPETPLTALALGALVEEAGFPSGTVNILTGQAEDIGPVLSQHENIDMLSFTGSTSVGKLLLSQAAGTVKKTAMELGGAAPFLIMDDADAEAAVDGLIAAKFRASGQACVAANLVLVQEAIAKNFLEALEAKVQNLVLDHGFAEKVDLGPLITRDAIKKVNNLVDKAQSSGARLLYQSMLPDLPGSFSPVTVMDRIAPQMDVATTEIFGPVIPVMTVRDEEAILKLANTTRYGLASYVYSRDIGRIFHLAENLEYGMVGINTGKISHSSVPFGGVKESGIGREGGRPGFEEFLETKLINISGLRT